MIVAISVTAFIVLTLIFYVAALRFPKWFFHRLHRHAQWRLRDDVFDQVLLEQLDRSHPAVSYLMDRSEHQARQKPEIDLVGAWLLRNRLQGDNHEILEDLRSQIPSLDGLPEPQRLLVEEFNRRHFHLAWSSVMLNSWPGLWMTMLQLPGALRRSRKIVQNERKRSSPEAITSQGAALQDAAFEAARRSSSVGIYVGYGLEPEAALAVC